METLIEILEDIQPGIDSVKLQFSGSNVEND